MIEYLNFFLYNYTFEIIISALFITNSIFVSYLDDLQTKNMKPKENFDKIKSIKIYTTLFGFASIIAFGIYKNKDLILTFLFFLIPLIALIKSISSIYNNKNNFSLNNKYINITSSIIFILFFSPKVTPVYLEIFANIPHICKEILLILYLIFKIILFIFLLLTNIFVLVSNINAILNYKKLKPISNYFIYKEKTIYLIYYDFLLHKKFNTILAITIDVIIFLLLIIPTIILNIIMIIFCYIIKFSKNKLYKIFNLLENEEKWNSIIKKITNISIIIAFTIVYIIMILFKANFSDEVIEIYTFLATVILLPLIYDSIKSNQ